MSKICDVTYKLHWMFKVIVSFMLFYPNLFRKYDVDCIQGTLLKHYNQFLTYL